MKNEIIQRQTITEIYSVVCLRTMNATHNQRDVYCSAYVFCYKMNLKYMKEEERFKKQSNNIIFQLVGTETVHITVNHQY